MASRSSRHRRRKKRRKGKGEPLDQHVELVLSDISETSMLLEDLLKHADPVSEIDRRIESGIEELLLGLGGYDLLGAVEAIRLITLPFSGALGIPSVSAQKGIAICEILVVALLGARADSGDLEPTPVDQEFCGVVSERMIPIALGLMELIAVRDLLDASHADALARIAASVRANGRWMRGTSYPEVQAEVNRGLFGRADIDSGLKSVLGFGVEEAIAFLEACHLMQMDQMNARGQHFADVLNMFSFSPAEPPSEEQRETFVEAFKGLFNPSSVQAAPSIAAVAQRIGISGDQGIEICRFFAADTGAGRGKELLRSQLDGASLLRSHPLIVTDNLVVVVHAALIGEAIKAAFEEALKATVYWDDYAAHRGAYLEARIAELFRRVVPGVAEHQGIEYMVPANPQEDCGDTSGYSKRVEGDHLFVLHDTAFIVEDKAIPLNDRSRIGDITPLRRNLVAAIKKGADQAARMKVRIQKDGGLRLRNGDWLDLSDVREIHSVVTSLDDMPGIATASAELARARLLSDDTIPWTVSLNDLELIVQLVDRPAEFLLYLRRRTEPVTTEFFVAVDELDLFLLFFSMGLFVEPDPAIAAGEMAWLGTPSVADLKRFREQMPALVTSHTDALDAWYYSLHPPAGRERGAEVAKPSMVPSPLAPLIDRLQVQGMFGWLSVGATLLEGSTKVQHQLAKYPAQLISAPAAGGKPSSMAVPWGHSKRDGWLLVWMTRPSGMDHARVIRHAHAYMAAKRHQLDLRRGAAFVYDEETGELIGASYDSGQAEFEPGVLEELLGSLRPPEDMDRRVDLSGGLAARRARLRRKKR